MTSSRLRERTGASARAALLLRQRKALAAALDRAARLPGYSDLLQGLPQRDPVERLRRLPVLTRQVLQQRPEAYRDRRWPAIALHTSGSTGIPLVCYVDHFTRLHRLSEYVRFFQIHGWQPWHRSVSLRIPDTSERVGGAFLDRTLLSRRTILSALDDPQAQLAALDRIQPEVVHGPVSVLARIADEARRRGARLPQLRTVFTASEELDAGLRRDMEAAFGRPVVHHYGAVEGFVGYECERKDGYHLNVESLFVEVVDDAGRPVAPGQVGRVAFTTLLNRAMPLLRYAVGDLAVAGDDRLCPCGRPAPILPQVLGRVVEMFELPSGPRSPWAFIAHMHASDGIARFQLVQTGPVDIQLRVQWAAGHDGQSAHRLRELARTAFGHDVRLTITETTDFARLPSGKFATALRAFA